MSSLKYSQANGTAKGAVKTVKQLLTKNQDPYLAILAYRSTQTTTYRSIYVDKTASFSVAFQMLQNSERNTVWIPDREAGGNRRDLILMPNTVKPPIRNPPR